VYLPKKKAPEFSYPNRAITREKTTQYLTRHRKRVKKGERGEELDLATEGKKTMILSPNPSSQSLGGLVALLGGKEKNRGKMG